MKIKIATTWIDKELARFRAKRELEILRAYKATLKVVRADLAEVYAKYSKGDKLTLADMSRARRLNNLEEQITNQVGLLHTNAQVLIEDMSGSVYQQSFYKTIYAVERGVKTEISFGMLDSRAVEAMVQAPINGLKLSQRLTARRDQVLAEIRSELTQGLILGEGYGPMAARIKDILDGDATKAITTARTEGHRVQSEGILEAGEAAQEAGLIMEKVWDATLDGKTRPQSQEMDGQTVAMDEDFTFPDGTTAAGPGLSGVEEYDINDRCVPRFQVAGYEPKFRREQDGGIIPYATYKEWAADKGIDI